MNVDCCLVRGSGASLQMKMELSGEIVLAAGENAESCFRCCTRNNL